MKMAIVGVGGMGGYIGGRLAHAGRDVTFIARGQHLQALLRSGLQVYSPAGDFVITPVTATDDPVEVGPVDLILLCVKSYDVADAVQTMKPMVGAETVILPVQNGLAHIATLNAVLGAEHILGGVAVISAHVVAPGVIQHNPSPGLLEFGEMSGGSSARCKSIEQVLAVPGYQVNLRPNIAELMWRKFANMCGASVFCVTRGSKRLVWIPEVRELISQTVSEVVAVAQAKEILLSDSLPAEILALWDDHRDFKPSMLRDLEQHRRLELEVLNGAVSRLGQELSIATPANNFIYACLKPYVNGMPQPANDR